MDPAELLVVLDNRGLFQWIYLHPNEIGIENMALGNAEG